MKRTGSIILALMLAVCAALAALAALDGQKLKGCSLGHVFVII